MSMAEIPVYRGNRLQEVLERFRAAREAKKAAEATEAEARQELLAGLGRRVQLRVGDWVVRRREVAAVPPVLVTERMVGERIGGRRGHAVVEVVPLEST